MSLRRDGNGPGGVKPGVRRRAGLVEFAIGFAVFVLLPYFVTTVAPVSTVRLSRNGGDVSATVTSHVFLVVPNRTSTLAKVESVESTYHPGERVRRRSSGRTRYTRSVPTATLTFKGPGGPLEVEVAPMNRNDLVERSRGFLARPTPEGLRLYTVPNWTVAVLVGGVLSLLFALFVLGWTLEAIRRVWRFIGGGGNEV